jgi:uncharacterized delta-60 repeat protein
MKILLTIALLWLGSCFGQNLLDSTFAIHGYTQDAVNQGLAHDVQVLSDGGSLMAVGRRKVYANQNSPKASRFFCSKYLSDGSLDPAFGDNGLAEMYVGPEAEAMFVGTQSNGSIVLAGKSKYCGPVVCGYDNMLITRLQPDGTPDSTFGITPKNVYTSKILTAADEVFGDLYLGFEIMGMAILPNDQIIIAGNSQFANNHAWTETIYRSFVVRLNMDGAVDSSFGENGVLYLPLRFYGGNWGSIRAMALGLSNNIYIAGTISEGTGAQATFDAFIGKVFSSGEIDSTFGTDGVKVIDAGSSDLINGIEVDSKDNIFAVGFQSFAGDSCTLYQLSRYGQPTANMPTGFKVIPFPGNNKAMANCIRIDQQDQLFIAGHLLPGRANTSVGFVGKLDQQGNWNTSFAHTGFGIDTLNLSVQGRFVRTSFEDIGLLPDGNLLLTGERTYIPTSTQGLALLAKVTPNDISLGIMDNPELQLRLVPNPSRQNTHLSFELDKPAVVGLELCDMAGKQIAVLIKAKYMASGYQKIDLALPQEIKSGQYIVRLTGDLSSAVILSKID